MTDKKTDKKEVTKIDVEYWQEFVPRYDKKDNIVGISLGGTWKNRPRYPKEGGMIVRVKLGLPEILFHPITLELSADFRLEEEIKDFAGKFIADIASIDFEEDSV